MADSVYDKVAMLLAEHPSEGELADVRATLALQLARKLDEAVDNPAAGAAQAVPGISKELRAVLEDIAAAMAAKGDFLAGVFAE